MRPIDADKTYEVLTDYYHHRTTTQHEALKDALSRVPTIEPKRGRWTTDGWDARCSECGWWVDDDMTSNYCPNCGAKMEDEDEVDRRRHIG